MAEPMTTQASDPVDPAVQSLRAANAVLDERPRAAVRDAILRAAANATAPSASITAPRKVGRRMGFVWSPSFAGLVTAGVALFAVAVLLNSWRAGPQDRQIELAQTDSPAAGASPSQTQARASAPDAESARPKEARGATSETPKASVAASETARANVAVSETPRVSMTAAPPSLAATPAPELPAPAAPPAAMPPAVQVPFARQRSLAATSIAQRDEAGPSVSETALAKTVAVPSYRASVRTWIDRLIELRRAHRDREADEELALFRAANPNAPVPEDAQGGKVKGP